MLKLSKFSKGCIAAALVCVLALSGLGAMRLNAAVAIEPPTEGCSLTIKAPSGLNLKEGTTIDVKLYKVAGIKNNGQYEPDSSYADAMQGVDSTTTAQQWQEIAVDVLKVLAGDQVQYVALNEAGAADTTNPSGTGIYPSTLGAGTGQVPANPVIQSAPTTTVTLKKDANGEWVGAWSGIPAQDMGMYLMVTDSIVNADETIEYAFSPSLISIPDNAYWRTNGAAGDEWIYAPSIYLKAAEYQLEGSLTLTKTLQNYNGNLGPATFIFQIEETGGTATTKAPYSNVIKVVFDGTQTSQTVTIGKLRAGSEVTVTEIYTGPSYDTVGESTKTVTIVADKAQNGTPASVSFTNDYNGGLIGGSSVENRFSQDENGEWGWEQSTTTQTYDHNVQ